MWLPEREGRGGHPGPPRKFRRCRERSQDARHVVLRVTGTSEDDEPLVQSCVQDTALDSVRVDLTVNDTDEEAVSHARRTTQLGGGRSPLPTVPASSATVRALHTGFASLGEVEEQPDAHCEREKT